VADFSILYEAAAELRRKNDEELSELWRDFVNNNLGEDERRWLLVPLTVDRRLLLQMRFASWWDDKKAGRAQVNPIHVGITPEDFPWR